VRHYPAEVVTERLVSDSESPVSSPVPNINDPTVSTVHRQADSPVRRRTKSKESTDSEDGGVTPVVVHEYGELLSFWRGDPTDGQLTRARAKSLREAGVDEEGQATVRDFDLPPEQWSSSRLSTTQEPSPNDNEDSKSTSERRPTSNINDPPEPVRRQGDDGRPASATAGHDISDKSLIHSTLGCVGQYDSICFIIYITCFSLQRVLVSFRSFAAFCAKASRFVRFLPRT